MADATHENDSKTSQENIRAHLYEICEVLNKVQKYFQKRKKCKQS